jgi:hypothetical protein
VLHLVNVEKHLRTLMVFTVATSVLAYYVIQSFIVPEFAVYKVITISSVVTVVVVWAILSPVCYRRAWKILRRLNSTIFQDMNGTWAGTIVVGSGTALEVRAVIRQSLLTTEVDVHGKTVKSITLAASPMSEAGQYKLYYVYRAEPKEPRWAPYNGTTKFTLRTLSESDGGCLALSGQYYTDRKMAGTIELRQIGADPYADVSYY